MRQKRRNPKKQHKQSLAQFIKTLKPLKQVLSDTRLPHSLDLFWDLKFGQELFDAWPKMSEYDRQRAKNFLGEAGFEARNIGKNTKSNPHRRHRRNPKSKKYALKSARSIARRLRLYGMKDFRKIARKTRKNCGCRKRK